MIPRSAAELITPRRLKMRGLAVLLLTAALAACDSRPPPEPPGTEELAAGRAHALALHQRITATPGDVAAADAVAAGYLGRLRLGMGSPFRLAEYALRDPRLTADARRPTAWALLAATADGQGYSVDPALFGSPGAGAAHLDLIRRSIDEADDPRAAELAVRLAYQLAHAEGTVGPATRRAADGAAELLRDRAQAHDDLEALLADADTTGADPLQRLVQWRGQRRFHTERHLTGPETVVSGNAAMRLAPAILTQIRAMEPLPDSAVPPPVPAMAPAPARRLLALADSLNPPPRAAVTVPVRQFLASPGTDILRAERRRLTEFAARVQDEERFVAAHALTAPALSDAAASRALATATVETAITLAAQGQERVWHPGQGGPTLVDLQWKFGLDSVTFVRSVPEPWRPYLLFALDAALGDWTRVFPAATLRGVHIRFGDEGVPTVALAVHSPRTRTVRLPPATGFGNLAHELGHEMDRAESERRYGAARRYATDDAVRRGRDDPFAAASRGILMRSPDGLPPPDSPEGVDLDRPAEIFARSVEWYVSAVLADQGRQNGDLVAVRDERLSGYGTMDRVAPFDSAAPALARTLQLMTPVPESDLRAFTVRYARVLSPRPALLADSVATAAPLRVTRTPRDSAAREAWLAAAVDEVRRVRTAAEAARTAYVSCAGGRFPGLAPSPRARLVLIDAAEEVGVRRVVRHYARVMAGLGGPGWLETPLDPFAPDRPRVGAAQATWLRRLDGAVAAELAAGVDLRLTVVDLRDCVAAARI